VFNVFQPAYYDHPLTKTTFYVIQEVVFVTMICNITIHDKTSLTMKLSSLLESISITWLHLLQYR